MARASGLTILSKLAKLTALIVLVGVLAAGFVLPYVGGAGLAVKSGADKFLNTTCKLEEEPVQQKTTFLASDNKTVIATVFDQNRTVVSLSQIPKSVINALISTEDRRFYEHHGVDIRGLARAALHTSGGNTQGASTLTEQYVKQVNYYNAITAGNTAAAQAAIDQNIDRKISDAQCALDLEKKYTKDQILTKYLNIAFFGENSYGIQTAAQTYFGVNATQLTVPQAALIVGLVQSPTYYDPFQNSEAARARRNIVLDNMATQKYITAAEATKYKSSPITLAGKSAPALARGCAYANPAILNVGYFCDYAYQWLQTTGGLSKARIDTGGLRIVTTLDVGLQNSGQKSIWNTALDPKSDYLLAMPSIKPSTGAVTTMITDKHYGVKAGDPSYSVGHLFTDAYAGSGSTYKYFTALAALKAGVPTNFSLTTSNNQYKPRNCPQTDYTVGNAGNYRDTLPLSLALPESSNTYFVAMEDELFGCNLGPVVDTATSLGMNYLKNAPGTDTTGKPTGNSLAKQIVSDRRPTFTLGQESTPVLELTGAFAALANDGVYCPPTPIAAVTDSTGQPVPYTKTSCTRQYDSFVARTLVNIMVNDTHSSYGTAGNYFSNWYGSGGSLVAAKTGTNNAADPVTGKDNGLNSALWFVGITPNLVSAAALVNPVHPNLAISAVPGITAGNDGRDTFGAFAATFWLDAYGPTLQGQQWTWPTVDSTVGDYVPTAGVIGLDPATATATLTAAGYKVAQQSFLCGSQVPPGNVAYLSPGKAPQGATITLCLSTGQAPTVYIPPVRTFAPAPAPSSGAPSSGDQLPIPKPSRTKPHG